MVTLRFRFERMGRLRFTSHLDILRTFQRAFRRAGLPLTYSQGYNPHPEFVIGLPLGVGTTSNAEYAEIGLTKEIQANAFINDVTQVLPEGLKILEAKYRRNKDNIMAKLAELSCIIKLELDTQGNVAESIDQLMSKNEILIDKKTKRGIKQVDIRTKIRYVKAVSKDRIELCCDAGSKSNLSPELFVEALKQELPMIGYAQVHRVAVRVEKNGKLLEPLEREALE